MSRCHTHHTEPPPPAASICGPPCYISASKAKCISCWCDRVNIRDVWQLAASHSRQRSVCLGHKGWEKDGWRAESVEGRGRVGCLLYKVQISPLNHRPETNSADLKQQRSCVRRLLCFDFSDVVWQVLLPDAVIDDSTATFLWIYCQRHRLWLNDNDPDKQLKSVLEQEHHRHQITMTVKVNWGPWTRVKLR